MNTLSNLEKESIVGKTFFKWFVVEKTTKKDTCGNYLYLVRCECGKECYKTKSSITNGTSKGCIQCNNKRLAINKFKDNAIKNIGKKFGHWEILDRIEENGKWNYIGKCACGNIKKYHSIGAFSRFTGCNKCCDKKKDRKKTRDHFIKLAKGQIGKTIGSFKVLGIDRVENRLIYMICKCLFCKKKTSIPRGSIPFRESCGCLREKNKKRGEEQYNAKLSKVEVLAIRDLFNSGLYSRGSLANLFGISLGNCCNIINNQTWKHI